MGLIGTQRAPVLDGSLKTSFQDPSIKMTAIIEVSRLHQDALLIEYRMANNARPLVDRVSHGPDVHPDGGIPPTNLIRAFPDRIWHTRTVVRGATIN